MSLDFDDIGFDEGILGFLRRNLILIFSVGSLVLNLLIFALVFPDIRGFSLILALGFAIYFPIAIFSQKGDLVKLLTRALEVLTALAVTVLYIVISQKYFLFILPAIEIAAPIVLNFLVFDKLGGSADEE